MSQDGVVTIGGEPVVTLNRPALPADAAKPAFVGAQVLPGRGMMILQITAHWPGRGVIELLESPPLVTARERLDDTAAPFPGNVSYSMGAAILIPFANRIQGRISHDTQTIATDILGQTVVLPANSGSKKNGGERYAMHGLLLDTHIAGAQQRTTKDSDVVEAQFNAGNFGGRWLSETDLRFEYVLKHDSFSVKITATNAGTEVLPIGIGCHPYFRLPSGDRAQARLHVPAQKRAMVDNYDEVLPTGQIVSVTGTPYDFLPVEGRPLGALYLDDCFLDLERVHHGEVIPTIMDPAAGYGIRVIGRTRHIHAIQVYAPPNKPYVALEPQFNLADPFGTEWPSDVDTGMTLLQPGESVVYSVALELFVP